jgi:ferredoxin-type protein NapF
MAQQTAINRRSFLSGHWQAKTEISIACLNNQGVYCQSCKEVCDEDAIIFNQVDRGIQLPMIISTRCTSCKDCVGSCPANAITIGSNPDRS